MAQDTATVPYWIIVSDEGTSTKPKHHLTESVALAEAARLSKVRPGINFTVFKSFGTYFTPKPITPETQFKPHQSYTFYEVSPFVYGDSRRITGY